MRSIDIVAQQDFIGKLASKSSIYALCELIWNGIDADANKIEINFKRNALDDIDEIIIKDDGDGIPYKDIQQRFGSLGGSWKAINRKTKKGRIVHGRNGQGRFTAFALGVYVNWKVVYTDGSTNKEFTVYGNFDKKGFELSDEETTSLPTGVTVSISCLRKRHDIFSIENTENRIKTIFAAYLANYNDIKLYLEDRLIDIQDVLDTSTTKDIQQIHYENKHYNVKLEFITWKPPIKEQKIYFCDENSAVLFESRLETDKTNIAFTAYIKSTCFSIISEKDEVESFLYTEKSDNALIEALSLINELISDKKNEYLTNTIEEWKTQEVYPYPDEPQSNLEKAEREIFDIFAMNLNEKIPEFRSSSKKNKRFQLRLLKQAIENSPEELQIIMTEVLNLTKQEIYDLAELLKNTSLSKLISASKEVSDRLRFLSGLNEIVYGDVSKIVKERKQLQKLIAQNPWIFADAFSCAVDDEDITQVLRKYIKDTKVNICVEKNVLTIDRKRGIIDLLLTQAVPTNKNESEYLVIELKAPKKTISYDEIEQIKKYAYGIAADNRFDGRKVKWNFLLIATKTDAYADRERTQPDRPHGLVSAGDQEIWVKTWAEIIGDCEYRLKFYKEKLDINVTAIESLKFLKEKYPNYVP